MIVENGLSENDYYEGEIYGLPLLESGFLQHIFLDGIFLLKNCRFLQPVQHIGFENCPKGETILLSFVIEDGRDLALLTDLVPLYLVSFAVKPQALDSVNIYSIARKKGAPRKFSGIRNSCWGICLLTCIFFERTAKLLSICTSQGWLMNRDEEPTPNVSAQRI